jgi:hypothetical protein
MVGQLVLFRTLNGHVSGSHSSTAGKRGPLHEQSRVPALFALRESPVDRMAPSPLDITSAAVQPMDCRRSEVPIVLQTKTRRGNTAIRRQNVIN